MVFAWVHPDAEWSAHRHHNRRWPSSVSTGNLLVMSTAECQTRLVLLSSGYQNLLVMSTAEYQTRLVLLSSGYQNLLVISPAEYRHAGLVEQRVPELAGDLAREVPDALGLVEQRAPDSRW